MILQAKFHVVSSLLSVLKIVILMLAYALPLKMNLSQKQNTVNLESASFVVIMLLHKGLTCIHSQKKPRLHFGESFILGSGDWDGHSTTLYLCLCMNSLVDFEQCLGSLSC